MPRLSPDQHTKLVSDVDRWLRKHHREPINLPALAKEIGISRFLLCRLYSERTGKTIRLKHREVRIACAAKLLSRGTQKIGEIARAVGYGSVSHFTKAFLEETGVLPSVWRSRPQIRPVRPPPATCPPPA